MKFSRTIAIPLSFIAFAVCAADDSSLPEFFAKLGLPGSNPIEWRWSPEESGKAIRILGADGKLVMHSAVAPWRRPEPAAPIPIEKSPEVGRGHGGMGYVNWSFGLQRLADLSMDITFHSEPEPSAGIYIQLYDFKIGGTPQYFGFQYFFGAGGEISKKFIWSRWSTRDKSDARAGDGGEILSSGDEGDYVSVRHSYPFARGTYTVHLAMRETDKAGTWYEMRIYDHQRKIWKSIGGLRFPADKGGLPFIQDGGGSWCEVFCGTRSSRDIGAFHLSFDGIYTCGRTIAAREARSSYGKETPNCDISTDSGGKSIHFRFGGETRRTNQPGVFRRSEALSR